MAKTGGSKRVPESAVKRLSVYMRVLTGLLESGRTEISSDALGKKLGLSPDQIRKDISYLGGIGITGVGYEVRTLREGITRILGTDHTWNAALVGVGNLGSALLAYPEFKSQGFHIVAAFDNDLLKIGKTWEGVKIEDVGRIGDVVKEKNIQIGVITVPPEAAQGVTNKLVSSGIKAILNFAPVFVSVPEKVKVQNVDLSVELEILSHFLSHQRSKE